jgi:hypothetical protein
MCLVQQCEKMFRGLTKSCFLCRRRINRSNGANKVLTARELILIHSNTGHCWNVKILHRYASIIWPSMGQVKASIITSSVHQTNACIITCSAHEVNAFIIYTFSAPSERKHHYTFSVPSERMYHHKFCARSQLIYSSTSAIRFVSESLIYLEKICVYRLFRNRCRARLILVQISPIYW